MGASVVRLVAGLAHTTTYINSKFLVTPQLFANEVAWESLRGTFQAYPWSVSMEESWTSVSASGGGGKGCILLNLQYWPMSSYLLSSKSTGDKAVFCSQAFSGLCYLKQITLPLQRQSAEQSILCTLCLTKPIGQTLPEEKISLLKKCTIFTQTQDTADV